MRLLFPYTAAADMHRLRGIASDVHEEHTEEGVVFAARLPVAEAARYARYSIDTTLVESADDAEPDDGAEEVHDD
jgi:hypothetical protein